MFTISELKERISQFPKKRLINSPTPFQKLENLSRSFEGPVIYMKRDDLTGLAFGGNKSRKLEFIIPDALNKKADVILTWASVQSNWCLQTAAAAQKFGIKPMLLLFKTDELPDEHDGNLLLDFILDADIRIKEGEKGKVVKEVNAYEAIEELASEVKERGDNPYVVPIGGSMIGGSMESPLGAISYVAAFVEMLEQAKSQQVDVDYIVLASGSGSTQAGLIVGAKVLKDNIKVLGISVSAEKESYGKDVLTIAQDTAKALQIDIEISEEEVIILDEYIKEGYGIMNKEVSEAIRSVAIKEGIMLDPCYTGKAAVALFDLIRKGYFKKEDKVVFFHTGGTPVLFPYKKSLVNFLKR
ncbi:MAG: pyridoxal-phosphate dependent enzyme [Candidatus Aminicenantes bacterium]|nr:pyridoxal-phosphate dependent enzyme [Candidatus Aminicenantes bacterium]